MSKSLFMKSRTPSAKVGVQFNASALSNQFETVKSRLNAGLSTALANANCGAGVYSPESLDMDAQANICSTLDEVSQMISSVYSAESFELTKSGGTRTNEYQINRSDFAEDIGRMAASLAMSPKHVLGRNLSVEHLRSRPRTAVIDVPAGNGDYLYQHPTEIAMGLEAYDERNNKDAIAFSVVWNVNFRQSPWAEAFFPSMLLSPDQLGLSFTVPVTEVQPELRRDISGDPTDFRRRNVVRALVDPTILDDTATDIVPVRRPQSAQYFPPEALIATTRVDVNGESVPTGPLLFGKEISMLSIGQTEALLLTGASDTSDAVDPTVRLRNIYAQFGDKAVKFEVHGLRGTTFNNSPQDEYRKMLLNVSFKSLMIDKNTKTVDGLPIPGLDVIVDNELQVRVHAEINGWIVLESGNTRLTAPSLSVFSVTDSDGKRLATDDPKYIAVADVIEATTSKLVCFDLDIRRTNSNHRQRGQMLNTNYFTQIHAVPLRAPITVIRPQNQGDQNDGGDIATLLQTTYARATNAAHDEFFRHAKFLEGFVGSVDDEEGRYPETIGVSRFYVRPFFENLELDVRKVLQIQSTGSKQRDVMEAICYTLRDQVARGYVKSEFKVGTDALRGPASEPPTVIIGVPPYLRQYLQIFGDTRIFGENFPYRIVESWNPQHKDKIVWSFGFFDGGDGQPNPLHHGILAIRPEITAVLSLPRNGGYSKELTVVPSFLHISNLPITGMITVTGLEALALESVAVPVRLTNDELVINTGAPAPVGP